MKARRLKPSEFSSFEQLAAECDSVFCSLPFLSCFPGDTLVRYGLFTDDDVLCGGFVLMNTRLRGIRALINPVYAPHCGLFTVSDAEGHGFRKSQFHKDVTTAIAEALSLEKTAVISLSLPVHVTDAQPFIWRKFQLQTKYTYRIDLTQSAEEILAGYDPKHRPVIRKYVNGEIPVTPVTSASELIRQIADLNHSKGIRKRDEWLENISNQYVDHSPDQCITARVVAGEQIASLAFCIHGRSECYYLMGAVNKAVKLNGASTLCIHHGILEAQKRGVKVFDFEGSTLPGVEAFFRSFGGELVPYFNVSKCPAILRPFLRN